MKIEIATNEQLLQSALCDMSNNLAARITLEQKLAAQSPSSPRSKSVLNFLSSAAATA